MAKALPRRSSATWGRLTILPDLDMLSGSLQVPENDTRFDARVLEPVAQTDTALSLSSTAILCPDELPAMSTGSFQEPPAGSVAACKRCRLGRDHIAVALPRVLIATWGYSPDAELPGDWEAPFVDVP